MRRDERLGFGREFQVANEDTGAAGVGEFGEGKADTWTVKSVERTCPLKWMSGQDQDIQYW